jgi:hypothetical protein
MQAHHRHHKVKKGRGAPKKFAYMDYYFNFEYLCTVCHDELHLHPYEGYDLQYRTEVYLALKEIFFKPYYNPYIIQKLLRYRPEQLRGLLKGMMPKGDQYASEDIIKKLMGGGIHENILAEVGE